MKPYFKEVFPQVDIADSHMVQIEKIVSSKDKSQLKVYIKGSKSISEEEIYSLQRQICTKVFSGQGMDVKIINLSIQAPVKEEQIPTEAPAQAAPEATTNKPKDKGDDGKKNRSKKDYGENVIFRRPIKADLPVSQIKDLNTDSGEVCLVASTFGMDTRELRSGKILLTMFLTDNTDSIRVKFFLEKEDCEELVAKLGEGGYFKFLGTVTMDTYDKELSIVSVKGVEKAQDPRVTRQDESPEKRVELHLHTQMSDMDGVIDVKKLMKRAAKWGHSAVAITDHGCVQAFPDAAKAAGDIKVIYGMEAYLCDDERPIAHVLLEDRGRLLSEETVIFDLETTGLNAEKESIIEIGAVKVKGGEVIDTFSAFVNPGRPLPYDIIELTGITDDMVKDAPTIEEIFPKFMEFCKGLTLGAHNAQFDISCILANAKRLGYDWNMSYLDTVPMARVLLPDISKFKLDTVAKALGVSLDNHHRAVDDAMCTAHIYNKFLSMLSDMEVFTLDGLAGLKADDHVVRKLFPYHATVLAKNDIGRINLYRLVSLSHLKYFSQIPRIPKSELRRHREGLLIGSGCAKGELFDSLLSGKNEEELLRIASFYDFLEVMPPENNSLLAKNSKYGLKSLEDIQALNDRIIAIGEKLNIPVVATGDAHFIDPEDELYRRIILSERKRAEKNIEDALYYRTTGEMMEIFSYLGFEKSREIVITNTNMIADMCEPISPTRPDKCPPFIENSDVMLRDICYERAHAVYGDTLPEVVEKRLERELNSIISNGYALMYIIAQKLVTKSNEDGYIVGSRGSVGSSFVATMAGISEVNPLPPHYVCPECHYTDFDSDTVKEYSNMAGCDMPDKDCPCCGHKLIKEGFDIPFETFLGFKGNKEPDIDLNFSGDYLNKAHKYTEVIFGDGQTYRAGTVGTLGDKTAFAYARDYYEKRQEQIRGCEIERRSLGCVGVRRTTGQHPGGIIVLPMGEEMESFTPVQHPANDMTTDIVTTHFDFHSIDSNLLKLDILGKDDPTQIKLLEEMTGIGVDDIPLDDRSVMSLFQETSALGISPSDINGCDFGTLGIPEFGTDFAMGILRDTRPQGIMDLVRIAGLSHGTDVYEGNAKDLIVEGTATLSTAICTRDDIMLYLQNAGLESEESFTIMESVRKGKGLKDEWKAHMRENNVPEWYITSCETIKYMFPKAHAAAYVMMSYRLGYYKVYYPLAFYAAYFSIKATGFNYKMMCHGPEVLNHYIQDFSKVQKPTEKEKSTLRDLRIVQEMYARGLEFTPMDLYESDAVYFKIKDGKLLPPFTAIEGMGDKAAQTLAIAAGEAPFTSKDDIRDRGKITQSVLDSMDEMGLLKGFAKSNQLSFFDVI